MTASVLRAFGAVNEMSNRAATCRLCAVAVFLVAAAIEARGDVLVADPVVVVADRTGRLEGRTTAAGGAIAAGDVVLEFSNAPDPTDELRIDILEIEREIAGLDLSVLGELDVQSLLEFLDVVVGQPTRPRVAAASSSRMNQLAIAAGSITRPITRKPHW